MNLIIHTILTFKYFHPPAIFCFIPTQLDFSMKLQQLSTVWLSVTLDLKEMLSMRPVMKI